MKNNELYHQGIKGMKWGVRRYQNKDGTWTPLGKRLRRTNNDVPEPKKHILSFSKSSSNDKGKIVKKSTKDVSDGVEDFRKKSPKDMSDEELKRNYERLAMEQSYKRLGSKDVKVSSEIEAMGKLAEARKKQYDNQNAELEAKIKRIKLEKEYAALTKEEIGKGAQFVEQVLKEPFKKATASAAEKGMKKIFEAVADNAANSIIRRMGGTGAGSGTGGGGAT